MTEPKKPRRPITCNALFSSLIIVFLSCGCISPAGDDAPIASTTPTVLTTEVTLLTTTTTEAAFTGYNQSGCEGLDAYNLKTHQRPTYASSSDACYYNEAYKKMDPRICEKIKLEWSKYDCMFRGFANNRNLSSCLVFNDELEKSICLFQTSSVLSDYNICWMIASNYTNWWPTDPDLNRYGDYIGFQISRDKCLLRLSGNLLNESICPSLNPKDEVICYNNIAILKNDSSICDKIDTTINLTSGRPASALVYRHIINRVTCLSNIGESPVGVSVYSI
jgi:hypothetical protein